MSYMDAARQKSTLARLRARDQALHEAAQTKPTAPDDASVAREVLETVLAVSFSLADGLPDSAAMGMLASTRALKRKLDDAQFGAPLPAVREALTRFVREVTDNDASSIGPSMRAMAEIFTFCADFHDHVTEELGRVDGAMKTAVVNNARATRARLLLSR